MKKKILPLLLIILTLCFSIPANAYQINGYEMHHEAGMVISVDTGTVIYSKNADKKMYPASITKLMSALVMVEEIEDLEGTMIPYTKEANNQILGTGSVVLNLKIGEEMSADDMLAALLISSCGDVAYAIAEFVGGSTEGFVDLMNKKAEEIGMNNTVFTDPVGLHDDEHYTTARDIYKMATAAFQNKLIKELCAKSRYTLGATNMANERTIVTSNMLLNPNSNVYYTYADAGKTGYTEKAGRCLVSTASYKGYEYMAIVLNTATPGGVRYDFIDIANMFRWAFNNFEYKSVFDSNTPVTEVPVSLSSETDHLPICFKDGLKTLLPKEADSSTISFDIHLTKPTFEAPVNKGQTVGSADIYYAEEKIGTLELVAGQTVEASSVLVFFKTASDFLTSGFMKIIYVALAVAALTFALWVIFLNFGKKKARKVKYIPLSKRELEEQDK